MQFIRPSRYTHVWNQLESLLSLNGHAIVEKAQKLGNLFFSIIFKKTSRQHKIENYCCLASRFTMLVILHRFLNHCNEERKQVKIYQKILHLQIILNVHSQ